MQNNHNQKNLQISSKALIFFPNNLLENTEYFKVYEQKSKIEKSVNFLIFAH